MGVHVSKPSCIRKTLQCVNNNAVKMSKKDVCMVQPWPIEMKSPIKSCGETLLSHKLPVSASLFLLFSTFLSEENVAHSTAGSYLMTKEKARMKRLLT